MPQQWGLDSVPFIDQPYRGTTLANYAINTWFASPPPRDSILWWGRYFTTTGGFAPFRGNGEAVVLINAIQANPTTRQRAGWILPISDDATATISGGNSVQGMNAGNAVCASISNWLNSAPNMHMPGSRALWIFLDIEGNVSPSYWSGWEQAVWNYAYNGFPYWPAAYGNPYTNDVNACSVIGSGPYPCQAFWSYIPQVSCQSPGPAFNPIGCPANAPPKYVWQYGQHCIPGGTSVDVDSASTSWAGPYGGGLMDYLIYCA